MSFQITPQLYEKIKHFAKFPQTAVSLRQMVMFGMAWQWPSLAVEWEYSRYSLIGPRPSKGTMFKASQFLHGIVNPHAYVIECLCISLRGITYSFGTSCQRAWRVTWSSKWNAIHHQGEELVCTVFQGRTNWVLDLHQQQWMTGYRITEKHYISSQCTP